MRLVYSGRSRPTAFAIEEASEGEIEAVREHDGEINWGRARANTSLNPDISNSTNKRRMRELFAENDVPMPELIRDTFTVGQPIVGRPDTHSKGRGFWLCHTNADVHRALRGTSRKRAATHFMAFVEADREYRVHIFKGKSIRISEKKPGETGDTSAGNYVTIRPRHDIKKVRKAAKKAVAATGLDFAAVDVLARGDENEEVWVTEVNAAPHLGGTLPRLYAETFRKYFEGEWDG